MQPLNTLAGGVCDSIMRVLAGPAGLMSHTVYCLRVSCQQKRSQSYCGHGCV